tara:strand:+ start:299 stop:505 length:207 start_codon:yes stop_codon:yes gene_type:complete
MLKTFIVVEDRVFKMLVDIDVPDDIQWQTEDYDNAIDAAVRKMDWSQLERCRVRVLRGVNRPAHPPKR